MKNDTTELRKHIIGSIKKTYEDNEQIYLENQLLKEENKSLQYHIKIRVNTNYAEIKKILDKKEYENFKEEIKNLDILIKEIEKAFKFDLYNSVGLLSRKIIVHIVEILSIKDKVPLIPMVQKVNGIMQFLPKHENLIKKGKKYDKVEYEKFILDIIDENFEMNLKKIPKYFKTRKNKNQLKFEEYIEWLFDNKYILKKEKNILNNLRKHSNDLNHQTKLADDESEKYFFAIKRLIENNFQ